MWIVSGSYDKTVRIWDTLTGAELKILRGHTDSVDSVAFSRDNMHIGSGSSDESVRVWNYDEFSSIDGRHSTWNLMDTNWIVSSQKKDHLMWVPQEAQVHEPSNILTISCYGFGSVDFQQSIGVEWISCYTP